MIRGYKYKLYASKHTKELCDLVVSSNFLWNHVVNLSRKYYKLYHKSLPQGKLKKHIAKITKKNKLWSNLHSQTIQFVCEKYDRALQEHFKTKGRGFPRTHKVYDKGSMLFKGNGGYTLTTNKKQGIITINKLNKKWKFKFKITRPWGEIKNLIIKKDGNSLYAIIVCDVPNPHLKREETGSIGMDFGMKKFLTLSNGKTIDSPQYYKQSLNTLRLLDRAYSLKKKSKVYGSSFMRTKVRKQKAYRKVFNRRADFQWKLSHDLCKKYKFIAIEDLNIKVMQKHKKWGRKVSDLSYSGFVEKLITVAEKYDTVVQKVNRWEPSSQLCSECGYQWKGTKDLGIRTWVCPNCGMVHDRDVNAAKNILYIAKNKYTGKGVFLTGSDDKSFECENTQRSHVITNDVIEPVKKFRLS